MCCPLQQWFDATFFSSRTSAAALGTCKMHAMHSSDAKTAWHTAVLVLRAKSVHSINICFNASNEKGFPKTLGSTSFRQKETNTGKSGALKEH